MNRSQGTLLAAIVLASITATTEWLGSTDFGKWTPLVSAALPYIAVALMDLYGKWFPPGGGAAGLLILAFSLVAMPGCDMKPADPAAGASGVLIVRAEMERMEKLAESDRRFCVAISDLAKRLNCGETPPDDGDGETTVVSVQVNRHPSVSLSNAEADRILADMSKVLSGRDSAADVPADIRYVRQGPVGVLSASVPATIQTQAQFSRVADSAPGVKVIRGINWCGGLGSGIIGCSALPSDKVSICVVRFQDDLEGILWAHETGHNAGNNHRTNDLAALMYPSIDPRRRVLNATESRNFLAGPLAAVAPSGECVGCDVAPVAFRLGEIVRQHWVEGIPLDSLRKFHAADVAELLPLLREPGGDEQFLPYVVQAICRLGDATVVPSLEEFLRSDDASAEVWRAKHAALIELRHLIDRTGDARAIDLLAEMSSQPNVAAACVPDRPLALMAEPGVVPPTDEELADELRLSAKLALQASRHPAAAARVDALRQQPAYAAVGK